MGRQAWPPAVLTVAGLVAVNEARKLQIGSVVAPGPGFFPLVLASAFSLVCLILLAQALTGRLPDDGPAPGGRVRRWKVLATLGAMLVYTFVLEPLGFVVSTTALLLFFFRGLERQRWRWAVAGSAFTAVLTYLVFKVWLQVRLPMGLWGL